MIIKGKSVAGAKRLAVHLTRKDQNERIEIKEISGLAADNLPDALHEMEALGAGTRAEKTLYHASINTPAHERLTDGQRDQAITALEKKLGLTGQPRIVVVHEKKDGREHCHIVWSRIDLERGRAISDSHNYRKHEEVARELEREFGLTRVQGAHVERDGKERPKRTPSHSDMLQAQRTGRSPQQITEDITAIWRNTQTGQQFAEALEKAGYVLARGDRRHFVVIDPDGGTHSLARRIEGVRVKDVRERMADVDVSQLPSVKEAKAIARERRAGRGEDITQDASAHGAKGHRADAGRSLVTHERPGAEMRAAEGVARGVGSLFDGIASFFERGLSNETDQSDDAPPAPEPEPSEIKPEPTVVTDEEERAKRMQELVRKFGRVFPNEQDAEFERQRAERERSR